MKIPVCSPYVLIYQTIGRHLPNENVLTQFQICSRNNCSASCLSIDKLHKIISVASNEQFSFRSLMFNKVKATEHTRAEIRT